MMPVVLALGLSTLLGLGLTAVACKLVLHVMPRRDR